MELGTILIYVVSYFALFVSLFFLLTFVESRERIKSPKPKKLPAVSIIVPAHNEEKTIAQTLRSIQKLNYPKNKLEVVLVDDGSTDRTAGIAKKFKGVRVFSKPQGGKASALNYGIEKAKYQTILTLDADCIPSPNLLQKLVAHLQNPRVVCVLPALKVWRPRKLVEKMQVVEYAIAAFIRKLATFIHSLNVAPGAALFRKKFFEKYGGFEEGNLTEDFEIGLRVQARNYDIAYALDSFVLTRVPSSFSKLFRQRVRWNYGMLENLKKYSFMFGLRYGDLGVFFMPVMLLAMSISIALLLYMLASFLWNSLHSLQLLSLVAFDLGFWISSFSLASLLSTIFSTNFFLLVVLLVVGALIYLLAKKSLGVKKFKLEFPIYLFLYGWLLAFFCLVGLIYFLLGRRPSW